MMRIRNAALAALLLMGAALPALAAQRGLPLAEHSPRLDVRPARPVRAVPPALAGRADFIPAPSRVDMAYEPRQGIVYVSSSDGQVLRYAVRARRFLAPIVLGGSPAGIDLSPDRTQLVVADRSSTTGECWIHLVDLRTLQVRRLAAAKSPYEDGTLSVAFTSTGTILSTSEYAGSSWVSLRRFDPVAGTAEPLLSLRNESMLAASGDRDTIAFAEADISDGSWGLHDVPTGQTVRRGGYTDGTSAFNFDIATDALGSQFALATDAGLQVFDAGYARVAVLGVYGGGQPVGVVYDPRRPLMYLPWSGTDQVRIYSTTTFEQVGSLAAGQVFQRPGTVSFRSGHVRIAGDGSLLLVSVDGGIRVLRP